MSGFKAFILRGNLIELAVAFIIGGAFATVVKSFTEWLTSLMPDSADKIFNAGTPFGAFLNAVVAFLLLAAVVYYFVVVPYNIAKEKLFPSEAAGKSADIALLEEIRDLLAAKS